MSARIVTTLAGTPVRVARALRSAQRPTRRPTVVVAPSRDQANIAIDGLGLARDRVLVVATNEPPSGLRGRLRGVERIVYANGWKRGKYAALVEQHIAFARPHA